MIEYRLITRRELVEWQKEHAPVSSGPSETIADRIPRSGLQRGATTLSSIGCNQDLEPDAIRAIAAFDGQRVSFVCKWSRLC